MKKILNLLPALFIAGSLFAQSSDAVLMKINGKPIMKSEFEYIYNKNNSNNSLDKKTLDEYVDLFVNFKLKVEEACAQGLDTTKSFVDELNGYRNQLTKPYLTDSSVDEELVSEAYDRLKEELLVSHILIRVPLTAAPADTLAAYNKVLAISNRLSKEDFNKVAREVSEDQSVTDNSGLIGWITGFRTVYPFETMAYKTPVGEISQPVRTSFGYHILKVLNRRPSSGEIQVAHIMKFTQKGNDSINALAKLKIDSIHQAVNSGADFGELAKEKSEDRNSAVKNGELPWFGIGRMVPEFENAAFKLNNTGDISEPIQSAYGWHIIKLLNKRGIADFNSKKAEIERMIKRDERANKGQEAFINALKSDYGFVLNDAEVQKFIEALNGKSLTDSVFKVKLMKIENKTLASYADQKISNADFASSLSHEQRSSMTTAPEIIKEKLDAFINKKILAYEDSQLEKKHEDFRLLMQEYHGGILLFDVSNKEVWDKASKDVEGLSEFFAEHKGDYSWDKDHFKGRVISCKDKKTFKEAQKIVKKSPADSIDKFIRTRLNDSIQHVKIEKGLYVKGDNKYIDKYGFKEKIELPTDTVYPFVFVDGVDLKTVPQDYTDVRGLVTADYQEYLEKEWIKALRDKYPVVIDKKVLATVKSN